jgi:hypothetical protein
MWCEIAAHMGIEYILLHLGQAIKWCRNLSRLGDGAKMPMRPLLRARADLMVCSHHPQALRPKVGCVHHLSGHRALLATEETWYFVCSPHFHLCHLSNLCPVHLLSLPSAFLSVPAFSLWIKHERNCKLTTLGLKKIEIPDSSRMEWMTFGHAPCDPLPFYQESNFWNRHGHGAPFDVSAVSWS